MGASPDPTSLVKTNPTASSYIQLDDGYQTMLIISAGSSDDDGEEIIAFWEKTVKPPGMDGGDAIDTTTMHNITWRTMVSRALITMTPCNLTAAYDPAIWDPTKIPALINVERLVAVRFPNQDLLGFYGFFQSVEPQDHAEGAQPEVSIVIGITNCDPCDRSEQAPVWVNHAGTACP